MRDGSNARLDHVDWQILTELQADARLSFSALGKRVHLSGPAIAERVRRLEDAGIITGPDCSILKVVAESMQDFERVIDSLSAYGTPASTLVLSSQLPHGQLQAPNVGPSQ